VKKIADGTLTHSGGWEKAGPNKTGGNDGLPLRGLSEKRGLVGSPQLPSYGRGGLCGGESGPRWKKGVAGCYGRGVGEKSKGGGEWTGADNMAGFLPPPFSQGNNSSEGDFRTPVNGPGGAGFFLRSVYGEGKRDSWLISYRPPFLEQGQPSGETTFCGSGKVRFGLVWGPEKGGGGPLRVGAKR